MNFGQKTLFSMFVLSLPLAASAKSRIPAFSDIESCQTAMTHFIARAEKKVANPAAKIRKQKHLKDIDCYRIMFIEDAVKARAPELMQNLNNFAKGEGDTGCGAVNGPHWDDEKALLFSYLDGLEELLDWKIRKKHFKEKSWAVGMWKTVVSGS